MAEGFLLGEFERIEESTHRRLAMTPAPLTLSFIVVLVEPRIKVCLGFAFLYFPIASVIVYSFNDSKLASVRSHASRRGCT